MYSVLVMSATSLQGYNHVTFLEFPVHRCQMLLHNHLPSKTGKQTSEIAFHLLQSEEIMELIKIEWVCCYLLQPTGINHPFPIPAGEYLWKGGHKVMFMCSVKFQSQQVCGFGDHLVHVKSQE